MSFRIGQKVRILVDDEEPEKVGAICTVTSALIVGGLSDSFSNPAFVGMPHYEVDMPPGVGWEVRCYLPWEIEPVDDGSCSIAWTSELRNLCGIKRSERA